MRYPAYFRMMVIVLVTMAVSSCYREHTLTVGIPSKELLTKWSHYLKVEMMPPGTEIATTSTHISNVGYQTAAAKISQALQSYNDSLPYQLSTVFQLGRTDDSEGENGSPALTAMTIQGHLWYIGLLDYVSGKETRAAFIQTHETVPAVAVVDGEDETKPASIRTRDENGNAYHITLRLKAQAAWDTTNIYRFLRNNGYGSRLSCSNLDRPTLGMDDQWRPYWIVTLNRTDNCAGIVGSQDWAKEMMVVDAQTRQFKVYLLDDPNTPENERDPNIPTWIDHAYSPALIMQYIARWGYNVDNYGKTSQLNEMMADTSTGIDEVMDKANDNIVYTAYITSVHPDHSLIGIMLVDPRTAHAKFYPTKGVYGMATKESAINTIRQATKLYGYNVEDLTLHTVYGAPTWCGEVTLPFYDSEGKHYAEHYAGTVLLRADDDLQPAHVIWASRKHEAFTKYEEHLYLRQSERIGSNVLEEKQLKARVSKVLPVVIGGNTSYLVNLEGQDGVWEVKISYIGDPLVEEVLNVTPGEEVFLRYSDVVNRKTHLVREFRKA